MISGSGMKQVPYVPMYLWGYAQATETNHDGWMLLSCGWLLGCGPILVSVGWEDRYLTPFGVEVGTKHYLGTCRSTYMHVRSSRCRFLPHTSTSSIRSRYI